MASVKDIRSTFLNYFGDNGHEIVASGSLVPHNDPSLMFTNAGMVPFKNLFTGLETRDYARATTAQKCVRAGGKHNDLDNVGYTARHHTFFEMLGNFSFGDYFKEEAIELAWNLITKEYGLEKDRLLITIYSEDEEAGILWKKIAGLSDDRIIPISTSDNFWAMGDTGPCGPCSEIFYDHGDHIWGGPPGSPEEDGDRFIEIWNLVFMQYEQLSKDERVNLPKPSIDTGMGLERISAILQGVHDNYDIDLFKSLIAASVDATGVKADDKHQASHRVIADHLRSSAFLIADGVLPSNEGRGYVLRRIMRRAMRHGSLLGANEPLMYKLLPTLVSEMGAAYPELKRAESLISETLKLEETRFRKTLARGLDLLSDASADLNEGDIFDGETAFKLYDTYGFPLDLTQDALRQREITVDEAAFNTAMERQKQEARANWSGSGDKADEKIWFELKEQHGASEFLGYTREALEANVLAIVVDGKAVDTLSQGEGAVVVNQTPFYGESGGQLGDQGEIIVGEAKFKVINTLKKADGLFVHYGEMLSGELKVGDAAEMKIDVARRNALRANHSATHLLHEALRKILGDHVAQKGSQVAPDRLRFDFSHHKAISDEELAQVEEIANAIILQNAPVETRVMSVDDAIEAGAMALFGEKYGDEVRVVSMGKEEDVSPYSLELCGGTHVSRTGDIGLVTLSGESAVASGVRRIEAFSGIGARQYLVEQAKTLQGVADTLKTPAQNAAERVKTLMSERKALEREVAQLKKQLAMGGGASGGAADAVEEVSGVKFMAKVVENIPAKELKGLVDEAKQSLGSGVVVVVGKSDDGKAGIVVGVTADLTEKYSAVDLVRKGSEALGGKGGGGRSDMAQAGGPDGTKSDVAIEAIKAAI